MKMKMRLALGLGTVSAFAALSARMFAADGLNITTQSGRPVHEVLMKIKEQYHWRIAYEEGPVLFEQDLTPVASPTGKTMLIHRAHSVSISLPTLTSNSTETKRATLSAVFEAFNDSGNPEEFRAFDEFGYINVVQTKIVGPNGRLEGFEPLFDTAVTLPRQSYSLYQLVSSIINQVSVARNVSITMATIPTSLFLNSFVTEESSGEPARKVLMRAFETINGPRLAHRVERVRLTWEMMYDAAERTYFFSVDNIEPEIDLSGTSKQ
jgi:hypothetical protein